MVPTHLDAGAGQIDIGSPLALHPAVLGGPGVHYWRLIMWSAAFSLSHILVRPGTAAGHRLWLGPLCGAGAQVIKLYLVFFETTYKSFNVSFSQSYLITREA